MPEFMIEVNTKDVYALAWEKKRDIIKNRMKWLKHATYESFIPKKSFLSLFIDNNDNTEKDIKKRMKEVWYNAKHNKKFIELTSAEIKFLFLGEKFLQKLNNLIVAIQLSNSPTMQISDEIVELLS